MHRIANDVRDYFTVCDPQKAREDSQKNMMHPANTAGEWIIQAFYQLKSDIMTVSGSLSPFQPSKLPETKGTMLDPDAAKKGQEDVWKKRFIYTTIGIAGLAAIVFGLYQFGCFSSKTELLNQQQLELKLDQQAENLQRTQKKIESEKNLLKKLEKSIGEKELQQEEQQLKLNQQAQGQQGTQKKIESETARLQQLEKSIGEQEQQWKQQVQLGPQASKTHEEKLKTLRQQLTELEKKQNEWNGKLLEVNTRAEQLNSQAQELEKQQNEWNGKLLNVNKENKDLTQKLQDQDLQNRQTKLEKKQRQIEATKTKLEAESTFMSKIKSLMPQAIADIGQAIPSIASSYALAGGAITMIILLVGGAYMVRQRRLQQQPQQHPNPIVMNQGVENAEMLAREQTYMGQIQQRREQVLEWVRTRRITAQQRIMQFHQTHQQIRQRLQSGTIQLAEALNEFQQAYAAVELLAQQQPQQQQQPVNNNLLNGYPPLNLLAQQQPPQQLPLVQYTNAIQAMRNEIISWHENHYITGDVFENFQQQNIEIQDQLEDGVISLDQAVNAFRQIYNALEPGAQILIEQMADTEILIAREEYDPIFGLHQAQILQQILNLNLNHNRRLLVVQRGDLSNDRFAIFLQRLRTHMETHFTEQNPGVPKFRIPNQNHQADAQDAGGVTREVLRLISAAMFREQHILPMELHEQKYIPYLEERNDELQQDTLQPAKQIECYEAFGAILARIFSVDPNKATIGPYLHSVVYEMLHCLTDDDLANLRAAPADMAWDRISFSLRRKLLRTYINHKIPPLRDANLTDAQLNRWIRTGVCPVEDWAEVLTNITPRIRAMLIIAKSMHRYWENPGRGWDQIKTVNATNLEKLIVGELTRQRVIEAFQIRNSVQPAYTNVNVNVIALNHIQDRDVRNNAFLRYFLNHATMRQIELLVIALTGSRSLTPTQNLNMLFAQGINAINFHTCFSRVDFPYSQTYQEFCDRLLVAINPQQNANGEEAFNMQEVV